MISPETRRQVWQGLLDAERLVLYYGALADRNRRKHLFLRTVLLLAAITGAASLVKLPGGIAVASSVVVTLAITFDFVFDFGGKAKVLHMVTVTFLRGIEDYDVLWTRCQDENMNDTGAREALSHIQARLNITSAWPGFVEVGVDDDLNKAAWESAKQTVETRFANEPS